MPSRTMRKTVLLFHIVASVGLFGAVAAFVALAVAGLVGTADIPVRAAYWAAGLITVWLILPLGATAFASGVLSGLLSPWGLFRHYWVVVKFLLTLLILAVLVLHAVPISAMAERAVTWGFGAEGVATDGMLAQRLQLVMASGAGLFALMAVTVLSVFKPHGLTRHGWRKQREAAGNPSAEP